MSDSHTQAPGSAGARPRHRWLYALPDCALPAQVELEGRSYALESTFKHDFFAATGLYRDRADGSLAVLKIGRQSSLFGLPLRWIGRFLARRESAIYERMHDLRGVPRFLGRVGDTGFLHAYVPGRPLERSDVVRDAFFDELAQLLAALHARGLAYVDLNKRQNVLLCDDGTPYLIDFQISLLLPAVGWRRLWPVQALLARFQKEDWYHFLKHKRRLRPDLLTPDEAARVARISFWIRLHRLVARPLTLVRRALLRRLRKGESVEVAGSRAK